MTSGFYSYLKMHYRLLLVILIMLLAVVLRFYNITNIGLSQVDEATYMLEGGWMNGDDYSNLEYHLGSSKPLFSYFISLSLRIFGHHDYAGIFVSAFFGSLTVLVVFFIGLLAYNYNVGLFAAVFLAFNKLHIEFSRNVYAEATMLFFFSLAFLFYVLSKKRPEKRLFLFLSGLSIGLSYDAKFLGVILLFIICLYELIAWLFVKGLGSWKVKLGKSAINCVFICLGFLLVFFATWAAYSMAGESYLFYFLHRVDQIDVGHRVVSSIPFIDDIPRYEDEWVAGPNFIKENLAYLFFMYKGFFFTTFIFLFAGLAVMLRKRRPSDLLFLLSFILTVLFVMKIAYGRPRTLMFFPLLIALIAAVGIESVYRFRFRGHRLDKRVAAWVVIGLLVFFAVGSTLRSVDVVTYENQAFKKTADFISDEEFSGIISTVTPITSFYSRTPSVSISGCDELGDLRVKGYVFIIIDTWELNSFDKESCFLKIFESRQPEAGFDYEVKRWHFPISELRLLYGLNSFAGSDMIGRLILKLDQSFITKEDKQQVLIYRI